MNGAGSHRRRGRRHRRRGWTGSGVVQCLTVLVVAVMFAVAVAVAVAMLMMFPVGRDGGGGAGLLALAASALFELAADLVHVPAVVPRRQDQGRNEPAPLDVASQGPTGHPEPVGDLRRGEQFLHSKHGKPRGDLLSTICLV